MQIPTSSSSQPSVQPPAAVPQEIQHAAAQPTVPPPQPAAVEPFYLYVESEEDADLSRAAPFQRSEAQAAFSPQAAAPGAEASRVPGASTVKRKWRPIFLLSLALLVALIVGVSVALIGALSQITPTPALTAHSQSGTSVQPVHPHATAAPHRATVRTHPVPARAVPMTAAAVGAGIVATPDWVPRSLPPGWTASGLTLTDAVYALRTATTFTDREMALDYRTAGTADHPSGSFRAATFLLTPAAQSRFLLQDRRSIDPALFQEVQQHYISQAAVDELPRLVAFRMVGEQRFAWVDVAFRLWRSQSDPATGMQTAGEEIDPATGQARVHHLVVVLVSMPPQQQGPNAPMGGTGWLVSTYALDQATLPPLVMPA
jgi:hypothetical protein